MNKTIEQLRKEMDECHDRLEASVANWVQRQHETMMAVAEYSIRIGYRQGYSDAGLLKGVSDVSGS